MLYTLINGAGIIFDNKEKNRPRHQSSMRRNTPLRALWGLCSDIHFSEKHLEPLRPTGMTMLGGAAVKLPIHFCFCFGAKTHPFSVTWMVDTFAKSKVRPGVSCLRHSHIPTRIHTHNPGFARLCAGRRPRHAVRRLRPATLGLSYAFASEVVSVAALSAAADFVRRLVAVVPHVHVLIGNHDMNLRHSWVSFARQL